MIIQTGFEDYILYKDIKIYKARMSDGYQFIRSAGEALTISVKLDKDLDLLGLPYLEYMYAKKEKVADYIVYWDLILYICAISFRDYYVLLEKDKLILLDKKEEYDLYVDKYNKEVQNLRDYLSKEYASMTGVNMIQSKIKDLEDKMYTKISFNSTEFEEIRNIICEINGFDNTDYDPQWEYKLKQAKEMVNQMSPSGRGLTIIDLINSLAFYLKRFPEELKDMSYYTFNHYVKMMGEYDEYMLCKTAELQGTEFKEKISHWLKHYTPEGKYDDVTTQNSSAITSVS